MLPFGVPLKTWAAPIQNTDGSISFEGTGNKTVDVHGIRERFLSLKIDVDWKRFEEINQLRNDIEHYYTSKSPDAVKENLLDAVRWLIQKKS